METIDRVITVTQESERAVIAHARGQLHPPAVCGWCKAVSRAYTTGKQMGRQVGESVTTRVPS